MIEEVLIKSVPQYGGLAILALFSFIMLKALLKALGDFNITLDKTLTDFNTTLTNHFRADQEWMSKMNETASYILTELKGIRRE